MSREPRTRPSGAGAFREVAKQLAKYGCEFHARGWMLGTSGNLSAVVRWMPLELAITSSGVDKGALKPRQILRIDGAARVLHGHGRPSAETFLHLTLVQKRGVGAVLHTHSIWSTLLSDLHHREGGLAIEGFEMLKGLDGVRTHEHREWLPIIENDQDIPTLACLVEQALDCHPQCHGFLVRRHGLYTWGASLVEARRHVEVLEFLLEVAGRAHTATHALPEPLRRELMLEAPTGGKSMAIVRISEEGRTLERFEEVRDYLAGIGIDYERWEPAHPVAVNASAEEILAAYSAEIERLKASGGYVTADVIDVKPDTAGLDAMLAKFNREHWHDEDEVRFIIQGRGLFHVRLRQGTVVAIEVTAGDLIRVPRGTWHWFDLCPDRTIRAIRLFQDPKGWTPHYTESGVDRNYEPVCLGPAYIPSQVAMR